MVVGRWHSIAAAHNAAWAVVFIILRKVSPRAYLDDAQVSRVTHQRVHHELFSTFSEGPSHSRISTVVGKSVGKGSLVAITRNAEMERAWMSAAASGEVETMRTMLETDSKLLNARLDHQTFEQLTALHLAIWKERRQVVEFLIDQGADIELQDKNGMTALQIDIMRICLQKMRPTTMLRSWCIDMQSPTALAIALRQLGRDRSSYREIDTNVLDLLLVHNANVDKLYESGDTVLLHAVEYGLIKHVEKLLAYGADARIQDKNGRSTLDIAGEHGFVDIVNALVENCPSLVDLVGGKTLVMAVRHEFPAILETLYDSVHGKLSEGDGEELGGRLLHTSAEYDAASCAKFLLKRGTPLDWENAEGENVVQVACAHGRAEILELLLEHSATNPVASVDFGRISSDAVALKHRFVRVRVFQDGDDNYTILHQDQRYDFPVFVPMKIPANIAIMEVLIRHAATFDFPTRQSRDSITPLLVSLLMLVAPVDVLKLLVDLANSGAIYQKQLRHMILALTWQNHTYEALMLALLILFTPRLVEVDQALAIVKPWVLRCKVNVVTRKLLTDALNL